MEVYQFCGISCSFFICVIVSQLWNDNSVLGQRFIPVCWVPWVCLVPCPTRKITVSQWCLPSWTRRVTSPRTAHFSASLSEGVLVHSTAQLQPFRSSKTCFGWLETDPGTEHEEQDYGRESSEWPQHKWKENSKKWLWETALQIDSTIPQVNLTARADWSTKVTLGSALTDKYWWSKSHVVLEAPEDQVMLTFALAID